MMLGWNLMLDCISSSAMSYSCVNLSKLRCVTTFCTRLGKNISIDENNILDTLDPQLHTPVDVFVRFVEVKHVVFSYPDQEVARGNVLK